MMREPVRRSHASSKKDRSGNRTEGRDGVLAGGVRYGATMQPVHMHRQGLRKRAFSLESAATTATGMVAAPELVGVKGGGRGGFW